MTALQAKESFKSKTRSTLGTYQGDSNLKIPGAIGLAFHRGQEGLWTPAKAIASFEDHAGLIASAQSLNTFGKSAYGSETKHHSDRKVSYQRQCF